MPGTRGKDAKEGRPGAGDHTFQVGDRVILHKLVKAAQLNGRHGFVAGPPVASGDDACASNNRYPVDLDLIVPKASNARVNVRLPNLQREPPLPSDSNSYRAGVSNGIIEECHGRTLSFVLDQIKFIVGYMFHDDPEIQQMGDIDKLKQSTGMQEQRDMLKLNHLLAVGWSHWEDAGSFAAETGDDRSVRERLVNWLAKELPEGSGGLDEMGDSYQRVYNSLEDTKAVAGWSVRVHADFWVVGSDPDGTLLVPDCNHHAVYKALGMTTNLYDMVLRHRRGNPRPSKWRLTLIPWYGRLVYDGVITPVDDLGEAGHAKVASNSLLEKLSRAVERAKEEGRVVERLAQLEVPGGSTEGIDVQGRGACAISDDEQPPPTREESRLLEELSKLPVLDKPLKHWTLRRRGYTEKENPTHTGMLILPGDTNHRICGLPFMCSALEPTSTDILSFMVEVGRIAIPSGGRPSLVAIDDRACYNRVKYLFKLNETQMRGTKCYYYLPPSKEELDAVHIADRMGFNLME